MSCAHCGAALPIQSVGRPRKFCLACRPPASQRPPRAEPRFSENIDCGSCGQSFVRYRRDTRFCSRRCRDRARRRQPVVLTNTNSSLVVCVGCGVGFRKQNGEIKRWPIHCCSNECKAWTKRTKLACEIPWADCPDCGERHTGRGGKRCLDCRRSKREPLRKGPVCYLPRGGRSGWTLATAPRTPKKWRPRHFIGCLCERCGSGFLDYPGQHSSSYRRCTDCTPRRWRKDKERAERYGVAYEPIDRQAIYERDEFRCGICGEQTDPTAKSSTPRCPTLDHVVPVSKGGPHTEANVQCACFECNWRKADGTDAEPRHPHGGNTVGAAPLAHRHPMSGRFIRSSYAPRSSP